MRGRTVGILGLIFVLAVKVFAAPSPVDIIKTDIVTISAEQQYETVQPGAESVLAIHFEPKKGWHFYASAKTAPGGMNLKIRPSADRENLVSFAEPIFPPSSVYFDKVLGQKIEIFSGKFTVFLPFTVSQDMPKTEDTWNTLVTIKIDGAVCSDVQCRMPDFGDLSTQIKIAGDAVMSSPEFVLPASAKIAAVSGGDLPNEQLSYPIWFALGLAFVAGLSLNIMPCVWPILPIIVLRIVEHAKNGKGKTTAMGLAFCCGILLFFACLAVANIILQLFYGTVLQWGDQFRSPGFVAAMGLLLVVLAMFMFDVFAFNVPASVSGRNDSGKGYPGTIGMGFLAAVLSTPCSFAILAAAFAWAQGQPLLPATIAIMVIGVGMGLPYVILTSMPGLLQRLPKPGRWMELFKRAVGFVLLGVAMWLITVLPQGRRANVLYFALVLSFCVWMWGGWVGYNSRALTKFVVRGIAVALAVAAGWWLLSVPAVGLIDWQSYDADLIETAIKEDRPVLIKFTADWCLSCKAVEKIVYGRDDVAKLIRDKNVLAIRADTTVRDYPATEALKNKYNEPGVPVSMLLVPGREEPVRWRSKSFAAELKRLLKTLPEQEPVWPKEPLKKE